MAVRGRRERGVGLVLGLRALGDRDAGPAGDLPGLPLVAERGDGLGRRPDPVRPASRTARARSGDSARNP